MDVEMINMTSYRSCKKRDNNKYKCIITETIAFRAMKSWDLLQVFTFTLFFFFDGVVIATENDTNSQQRVGVRNLTSFRKYNTTFLDYAKNQRLLNRGNNDTWMNDQNQTEAACSFRFHPQVRDFTQGWVTIDIVNTKDKNLEFEHFLGCRSLTLVKHASEKIFVRSKKTGKASFLLKTSSSYSKKNPEQTNHKCVFSTWVSSQKEDIGRCTVKLVTQPGGTAFLKECYDYKGKSLDLVNITRKGNISTTTFVTMMHYGNRTHYSADIACQPDINLLHHGKMYNSLGNNRSWKIPLFPNCSNVLDIDYTGICRLSIYHLCQEKSKVMEYSFPYYEGYVEECARINAKSFFSFSDIARHPTIVTSFLVFVCLVVAVSATFVTKFVVMVLRHGIHYGPIFFKEDVMDAFSFCRKKRKEYEYET